MPQTKSKSTTGTKASNGTKKSTGMTKPSSQAAGDLMELFEDQLKDLYWAEKALVKALPKMAKNATAEELITAINNHVVETEGQVQRLEQVFETLGKTARGKKCEAMEGLIKEGESIVEDTEPGPVRDAGIIAAGQKIEHYEIASYGTLVAFSKLLKEDEIGGILDQTLTEEKNADKKLTEVAENSINLEAAEND